MMISIEVIYHYNDFIQFTILKKVDFIKKNYKKDTLYLKIKTNKPKKLFIRRIFWILIQTVLFSSNLHYVQN